MYGGSWLLFLQSKEKLISSLKEGSGLEVLEGAGAGAGVELEELRHEKELQREDIQKLQAQIQSLRTEIEVHMQDYKIYHLSVELKAGWYDLKSWYFLAFWLYI